MILRKYAYAWLTVGFFVVSLALHWWFGWRAYADDAAADVAVRAAADAVGVIGENRKMLVFPLAELPELGRGQGVTLQRYRDGGLSDAMAFPLAEGLSWPLGGESGRVRTETDLSAWRAARGAAGRMPPVGFPRNNRFG